MDDEVRQVISLSIADYDATLTNLCNQRERVASELISLDASITVLKDKKAKLMAALAASPLPEPEPEPEPEPAGEPPMSGEPNDPIVVGDTSMTDGDTDE